MQGFANGTPEDILEDIFEGKLNDLYKDFLIVCFKLHLKVYLEDSGCGTPKCNAGLKSNAIKGKEVLLPRYERI